MITIISIMLTQLISAISEVCTLVLTPALGSSPLFSYLPSVWTLSRLVISRTSVSRTLLGMTPRPFSGPPCRLTWAKSLSNLLGSELDGRKVSKIVANNSKAWLTFVNIASVRVRRCGDKLSVVLSVSLLGRPGESRAL